ncbi:MAG: 4Fe-4S binding protein [Firmicutes bacterium]|jgi:predicted aldo/keto reductase-like oxidoreductase|nr:4Fe-4S binding protein [Bacillota bacterium]
MNYRKLGNTGLLVSEIGLGCEGFSEDGGKNTFPMIETAERLGINYIDLYTPDPEVREALGTSLKGKREKFILQSHICSVWKDGQYKRSRDIDEVKKAMSDMLSLLKTDYIDVGMIHYVDSMEDWRNIAEGPVLKYVVDLKEKGIIKHIGLSSHNPEVALEAINTGHIEVLMFSVNPCYDLLPASEDVESLWDEKNYENHLVNMDPKRQELYETCQSLGVGVTVMKAFGGGDLLSAELSLAGKALTVNQCIHYALTRPAVATILAGAHTISELEKSAAYEQASDEERDYAEAFAGFSNISWEGHCMYCSHCAPCPKKIDVATVTKFLNLAKAQGTVPETVREHYKVLSHHASECIGCRACEKRCPFGVHIVDNMSEAEKIFGI